MSREVLVLVSITLLHILWVLLPLIPAVLIYKLFPDTAVAVSGPFAALSLRASGAFAGYLAVFAATFILVHTFEPVVSTFEPPFWTVYGKVALVGKDDKEIASARHLLETLRIIPQNFSTKSFSITMKIPEEDQGIPELLVEIPSFGTQLIKLTSENADFNMFPKSITLKSPITIKEEPVSASYDAKPQTDRPQ